MVLLRSSQHVYPIGRWFILNHPVKLKRQAKLSRNESLFNDLVMKSRLIENYI
jgi:hypothetical protein